MRSGDWESRIDTLLFCIRPSFYRKRTGYSSGSSSSSRNRIRETSRACVCLSSSSLCLTTRLDTVDRRASIKQRSFINRAGHHPHTAQHVYIRIFEKENAREIEREFQVGIIVTNSLKTAYFPTGRFRLHTNGVAASTWGPITSAVTQSDVNIPWQRDIKTLTVTTPARLYIHVCVCVCNLSIRNGANCI